MIFLVQKSQKYPISHVQRAGRADHNINQTCAAQCNSEWQQRGRAARPLFAVLGGESVQEETQPWKVWCECFLNSQRKHSLYYSDFRWASADRVKQPDDSMILQ